MANWPDGEPPGQNRVDQCVAKLIVPCAAILFADWELLLAPVFHAWFSIPEYAANALPATLFPPLP